MSIQTVGDNINAQNANWSFSGTLLTVSPSMFEDLFPCIKRVMASLKH